MIALFRLAFARATDCASLTSHCLRVAGSFFQRHAVKFKNSPTACQLMISCSISLPVKGSLSPFPRGTCSLSLTLFPLSHPPFPGTLTLSCFFVCFDSVSFSVCLLQLIEGFYLLVMFSWLIIRVISRGCFLNPHAAISSVWDIIDWILVLVRQL